MAPVYTKSLTKRYGTMEVVRGLDLEIADREFVALVGPSGCGKSTTLRMIAGLETISDGTVEINGKVVNELSPRDRNIAMVFQSYALYPHMTVRQNMGFSMRLSRVPKVEIERQVNEAARVLQLHDLLDRRPSELSGGQRQRVAMGRAIVRDPSVFLFDEPLSNLDAKLRAELRTEIKRLHNTLRATMIYVTHDQVEAMTLADRVVVMNNGSIEQVGTPEEVFSSPKNLFVGSFIGSPSMNLLEGEIADGMIMFAEQAILPIPDRFRTALSAGDLVTVGIRVDDVFPTGHGLGAVNHAKRKASVVLAEPLGNETLLTFRFGGAELVSRMLDPKPILQNTKLEFSFALDKIHLFEGVSGRAIAPMV